MYPGGGGISRENTESYQAEGSMLECKRMKHGERLMGGVGIKK